MRIAVLVARILLGLIFAVFSLNHFVGFMPQPDLSPQGQQFIGALVGSGYLFTFLKVVELVAGLLLLVGILVPLALTLLAPIVLNIFLFNLFLDSGGLPIGVVVVVLELFLAYAYRDSFKGILNPGAQPS